MFKTMKVILVAGALLSGAAMPAGVLRQEPEKGRTPDVVYVGTPYDLVSRMLRLASVKKNDLVYDLGCGDGRMLVLAAQKYGCHGIGYDIDPERVAAAMDNVRKNGVEDLVKIIQGDFFKADLSNADVLLLYLLPELNQRLVPQIEKMKRGARLVLHDYALGDYKSDQTIRVRSNEDNSEHTLYLYTIPLEPAGN